MSQLDSSDSHNALQPRIVSLIPINAPSRSKEKIEINGQK